MAVERLDPETVFHAARQLPPADRPAYLDEACGDDPAARRRIERLLAAAPDVGSFLDGPAPELDSTRDWPGPAEGPGTVVGPYRLLEPIGEGAFGVVFLAEQSAPLRRRVALKVLKPGMDTKQVVARFEAERQALALMDHPAIATVFDGGATPLGRPYFVMELVRGLPITEHCDRDRLGPRDRLGLFVSLCGAVQHAHQKGVIHRDLKPSNVLVTMHDATPAVKVIDFGIAKALGRELTDKTFFTGFAQLVGTPLYMSPEQAGQSGLDIDTRSDVYSLGVLLYELLTGTTPFDRERFRRAEYDEIRRIIREEEPPRPSTRLSTLGAAAETVSANRGSEPRRLAALVRGELDWIVMKCLEKDRNRRYETATALAADVQRYLADEPVLACPPSRWYRVRKLVRRNKRALSAALAFVLVLVSAVVGLTVALLEVRREQGQKEAALAAEGARRKVAREALDVMSSQIIEDWLSSQDVVLPEHKEFLKLALRYYEEFAADTGQTEEARAGVASAYRRVGTIYLNLHQFPEAEAAFARSRDLFAALVADFPTSVDYRRELAGGEVNLGMFFHNLARDAEAKAAGDRALALRQQLATDFPDDPSHQADVAHSYGMIGLVRAGTGPARDAEDALNKSLAIRRRLAARFPGVPDHRRELAIVQSTLAELLHGVRRHDEAESSYKEALTIRQQLAAEFPESRTYRHHLAASHEQLGEFYRNTGRFPQSEGALGQALAIYKQSAAQFPSVPNHRAALADCQANLGLLYRRMGRARDAEDGVTQAVALYAQLAADFPLSRFHRASLAEHYHNLGLILDEDAGRRPEAEKAYRQALALRQQLAAEYPARRVYQQAVALTQNSLGVLFRNTDRPREAEEAYRQALAVRQRLAADSPANPRFRQDLAITLNNLANVLKTTGREPDAEAALRQALDLHRGLVAEFPTAGDHQNELAGNLVNLARLLRTRGQPAEARRLLEEARPHHLAALKVSPRHPAYRAFYRNNRSSLTETLLDLGEHAAAAEVARELVAVAVDPARDGGNAACFLARCASLAREDQHLAADARGKLAATYEEGAVAALRDAIGRGFRDAARLRTDAALDPLRARPDFQKLLTELETKKQK